jgi:DNA-directed RNA polymerase specialized sigma24 family protein
MAQQDGNVKRAAEAMAFWMERKAELLRLYKNQGCSQEKIAGYFGVTLGAIQKAMTRHHKNKDQKRKRL